MHETPKLAGYRLVSEIGEGGMATVYEAVQLSLERPVALKLLAPELSQDPTFARRFLREAKIVGRLAHASIVPVYEVGEQDGRYFIAMEYVNGGDLHDAMREGLCEEQVHSILTQVAHALNYAHERNIVHRDIKPDNVLMRDSRTAMVADFGIAREIATSEYKTSLTEVQSVIGSPAYMSPEQMRAESLDQRTDIYSLGVVAWQLLTGERPFSGRTLSELAVVQATVGVPELPNTLNHWQPLMNGMLAYDRDERFTDCDAVLSQLAQLKTAGGTIVVRQRDAVPYPVSGNAKHTDSSTLSMQAFVSIATGVVLGSALLFWWLFASSITVGEVPVVDSAARVYTEETRDEPSFNSFDASAIATSALVPGAADYFAFRDLLAKPSTDRARAFVLAHSDSLLADVVSVSLLDDADLVADLVSRAERGELRAMLVMSDLLANGWGLPLDTERAMNYALRASETGSSLAQYQLASLQIATLDSSSKAVSTSISLPLTRAAEGGFFLAQTLLGDMEFGGRITGQSRPERSRALYQQAAAQGDRNALFALGLMYQRGLGGLIQDPLQAERYMARARELGHPQA